MYCGDFGKVALYVDEFSKKHPQSKIHKYLSFDAAVSVCYTAGSSIAKQQSLKETLKSGIENRLCCMMHVILAIGAIHNMGDTELASALAKDINESECDKPALLQLQRLRQSLNEGTQMQPTAWD
jgi:hypothetical protein